MRAIWKGAVSFGLVSIGVKMYSATEERDISFHQVRRSDGSRIRYRRVAEADGEEVAYSDIAKGYSLPSGETIVLTDEDLADLPLRYDAGRRRPAIRTCRAGGPYLLRAKLLPGTGKPGSKAVSAVARCARGKRHVRIGQGGNPKPGAARDTAGARRCDRAGDDDLAGRGAGSRVSVPGRECRPATARARDGGVPCREHGGRFRSRRL